MPPKKARSEKNQPKISFFTTSEKENPWSEDETDTGTTTEANEPIEVDDDVSHESQRKQGTRKVSVLLVQFIHVVNIRQR
jgi:hypothetical protein